jgi:hypothetical protein
MLLKVNNKGIALLAVAEQMATQCENIFLCMLIEGFLFLC